MNKFREIEAEAVVMLQAANPQAWDILKSYFERQFDFEVEKCIDSNIDMIKVHQGKAKALRDAVSLSADAHKLLS